MAQGFQEVLDEDYLQYRLRSVAYLGEHLLEAGIQIIEPPGTASNYYQRNAPPSAAPHQAKPADDSNGPELSTPDV